MGRCIVPLFVLIAASYLARYGTWHPPVFACNMEHWRYHRGQRQLRIRNKEPGMGKSNKANKKRVWINLFLPCLNSSLPLVFPFLVWGKSVASALRRRCDDLVSHPSPGLTFAGVSDRLA